MATAKLPRKKPEGLVGKPRLQRVQRHTRAEICRLLDVSGKVVSEWTVAGCPRLDDGSYLLPDVVAWLRRREKLAAAPTSEDEARTRKLVAEAQRAELELAAAQGRYLLAADVEREQAQLLETLNAALDAIPTQAAPAARAAESTARAVQVLQDLVDGAKGQLRAVLAG